MRFALVAIATTFFVQTAGAKDAKGKTCVQMQKQYAGIGDYSPEHLDKVHKMFGQPSRIDRGAYKVYDIRLKDNVFLADLLVFDFPGCYFFVYVDREGMVVTTHEFHFRSSELVGKQATAVPPQQTDVAALYRAASSGDTTSLKRLSALAQKGDPVAETTLGYMYENGQGVPKDAAQAVTWYRKAADQGYAVAQSNLGGAYYNGQGVPKDAAQAVIWYRKAADQGNAMAQYSLGTMYLQGDGVTKDSAQALPWYRQAAEQGDALAQYGLGYMYENGQGVAKDPAQAVTWYRKAAERGNAMAQRRLGEMNAPRSVQMVYEEGVYKVPVRINNVIVLDFIVDSGAADVSIPADVVLTLIRTGTIVQSDSIGAQTYVLADGSTKSSSTFHIRSLRVGDMVLQDVVGSVADEKGPLLLGQGFLGRFKSWSINNTTHTLILEAN